MGVFYYLTMTTPGLQTDVQMITRFFNGKLHIESLHGKLLSDFDLQNVTYQDNNQSIRIKSLAFSWNPVDLLMNKLMIHSIALDDVTVVIPKIPTATSADKTHYSFLNFLKNTTIQQARLNHISIQLADSLIVIHGTLKKSWDIQWKTKQGSLSFTGNITGPFLTPKIFSASNNLRLLTYYFPELKEPSGTLQTTIWINGLLNQPDITAHFKLINGKVRVPALGITPQNIHLEGTMTLDKQLHFSGSLLSGKGRADLQGSVDFNQPDYPLTLRVKGSELQAIHLPEYDVIISPDVTLHFAKQNLTVDGTLFIPSADITPHNFNSMVTLPDDVVFVHEKQSVELPFTTTLQLTLKLGDNIHLTYHDLETALGGQVQLTQLPGTLINAVGELFTKKGTYTAYGQTLTIQTGRLIYTGGSLMNPGLMISAVKKLKSVSTGGDVSSFSGQTALRAVYAGTQSITVGVEVSGTLQNPRFNLFSSPALSQADCLSYLIFEVPQSQANGIQYGAILSALASLNPNMQNAGHFTKTIQQKLGLTEMGVQSVQVFNPNATNGSHSVISTTSFVVGKKLSDKLSIHYSVGLFYPVSILNLRYELTKHWAIQSETSTLDNGADVLYTIEQD